MVTNKEQNKQNVPHLRFSEFHGEWEKCKLGDIAEFSTARISSVKLDCKNYVSTENMLQDFQGVVEAKSVPNETNVISFTCGDILISNIRPYLKKVWKATFDGGCSSDVFVLQATDTVAKDYLHYAVANDKFINYVMSGAKGVKMPRGDKNQMRTYQLSLPSIQEQYKIAKLLTLLDERIATQSKLIEKLESLIKGIAQHCIRELLISGNGANLGYINYYKGKFNAYQRTYVLDHFSVNIQYVKWALKVLLPQRIAIEKSSSNTPYIVLSTLADLKIPIPNNSKQNHIADLMMSFERKLSTQLVLSDLYNKQKQYLLRQMFI